MMGAVRFKGGDAVVVEQRARLLLPAEYQIHSGTIDYGYIITLEVARFTSEDEAGYAMKWGVYPWETDVVRKERLRFYASFDNHQRFLEWFADNSVAVIRERGLMGLMPTELF